MKTLFPRLIPFPQRNIAENVEGDILLEWTTSWRSKARTGAKHRKREGRDEGDRKREREREKDAKRQHYIKSIYADKAEKGKEG